MTNDVNPTKRVHWSKPLVQEPPAPTCKRSDNAEGVGARLRPRPLALPLFAVLRATRRPFDKLARI